MGTLKPIYNFLHELPDLSRAPLPRIPKNLLNRYAVRQFGTLDCGRGCPFQCSFCTVINVQGRMMRFRAVESIMEMIRSNYFDHKICHYFFTDDNFSRNKNWEAIFDALTRLREEEEIKLTFMMQVDTQSYRIPNFIEKARHAGCSQVFIGVESINEENLKAAGKRQNLIADFKTMIHTYQQAGIVTHLAYIIGFPFDSEESVRQDIARLRSELGAEQASFFMLTPLPGSEDYRQILSKHVIVDADLNNYDSFHETFRHPLMKPHAWNRIYEWAWKSFYSLESLKNILRNAPPHKYWGIFWNFVWYKNAIQVEGGHPMLHGFLRLKNRRERRSIYPVESRWNYLKRRIRDLSHTLAGWVRLALEMEEAWLATRQRNPLEERVVLELLHFRKRVKEWRNLRLSELQLLYHKAALTLEHSPNLNFMSKIRVPSRFQLWIQKWNVFSDSLTFTRFPMKRFWSKVMRYLKQGRIDQIRLHEVIFMTLRESTLFVQFVLSAIRRNRSFA